MEENNEIIINDNEDVIAEDGIAETPCEKGKYLAAGVAVGLGVLIVGKVLTNKVIKPLKRKLIDKLYREAEKEALEAEVVVTDAEVVPDDEEDKEN